jgi:hypothetical protein
LERQVDLIKDLIVFVLVPSVGRASHGETFRPSDTLLGHARGFFARLRRPLIDQTGPSYQLLGGEAVIGGFSDTMRSCVLS